MQMAPFMDIGVRLAEVRRAFSEMSQKDWALRNGFEVSQYNNWERGARRIPIDSALQLCGRYGLTLDYIYTGRCDALSNAVLRRLHHPRKQRLEAPPTLREDLSGEMVGDDGLEPPTFSV